MARLPRSISGDRHRRPVYSENGCHPFWLPGRAAVWLEDSAMPPGAGPAYFSARRLSRYADLAGVSTEVVASAGLRAFAKSFSLPTVASAGPPCCRSLPTGSPAKPCVIDLAPGQLWTAPLRAQTSQRDLGSARTAMRSDSSPSPCRSVVGAAAARRLDQPGSRRGRGALHHWTVYPAGTEGYDKAEVTAGGVDTAELSARTMESRKVPGLYFIGEVVDVTGHLGGFNFQWAWASGAAAGRALAG